MARTQYVDSQKEKDKVVDDFMTREYKIKKNLKHTAKVKKKSYGDPITHAFLFFFVFIASTLTVNAADVTAGLAWIFAIASVIGYAIYSWISAEEVIIKVEQSDPSNNSERQHREKSHSEVSDQPKRQNEQARQSK